MRQYAFPHPWDYHRQAAIVVVADSVTEARAVATRYHEKHCTEGWVGGLPGPCTMLNLEHPRIIRRAVYEDRGCDC